MEQRITVDLIDNDSYDSTLEFNVVLHSATNALTGEYLFKCSVLIVDDDTWPTNKFEDQLRTMNDKKSARELPGLPLLYEFMKMLLQDRRFRRCFMRSVAADQLVNIRVVWEILLQIHLLDFVLAPTEEGNSNSVYTELCQEFYQRTLGLHMSMLFIAAMFLVWPAFLLYI